VVLHARSADRAAIIAELASRSAGIVVGDLRSGAETRSIGAQPRFDPEGHAGILAVNTLAPYMLTALIQCPGRLVYLSSGLHRGGEGSLGDLDWTKRAWDPARAYAESKLHVAALALAVARRWPQVLSNAVDPGWARTKMGGAGAPVDVDTGQRTQSWLAVSDEPAALVSGRYWHHPQQGQPALEATDPEFQDQIRAAGRIGGPRSLYCVKRL
jgi:NAD(P)-dependent dehydrogenase (short-subunit alcohol dehydrogenase family)